MPTGMWKHTTASTMDSPSAMIEHQCVATLKAPMRTKKAIRGAMPTIAVRNTFPPTADVDGVKYVCVALASGRMSRGMRTPRSGAEVRSVAKGRRRRRRDVPIVTRQTRSCHVPAARRMVCGGSSAPP